MQDTLQSYFESIHNGGWQDFVDDDIVFMVNSLDNKVIGKEGYLKGAGTFFRTTTAVDLRQFFVDGDKVSVLARYSVKSPDGRQSFCDVAEFLEFKNQKIVSSAIFFDTKMLSDFMKGEN